NGNTRSRSIQLLSDIRHVFAEFGEERIRTQELIDRLSLIEESPWGDYRAGKPITGHSLARLLNPYGLKTMTVKSDGVAVRGYKLEQFADAFARYLPQESVTSVTSVPSGSSSHAEGNAGNAGNASVLTLVGDPGYLELLAEALRNGHITEAEAEQRHAVHKLL